jgi:tRNA(His) guanylyltransferase
MKDSLGDRMKKYENASRFVLPPRMPVIIRVDGRAFHTWTRDNHVIKPFDDTLIQWMNWTAVKLCAEIQGSRLAYVQSDEISVLVVNYATHESTSWFDNVLQKMVSVAASVATLAFSNEQIAYDGDDPRTLTATFDARAFVVPREDVANYFLWRQNNWTRNSVRMLASSLYSHEECDNKSNAELQEMCFQKGHNWNDLPAHIRRGRCVWRESYYGDSGIPQTVVRYRWAVKNKIPIFKGEEGRGFIEHFLKEMQ